MAKMVFILQKKWLNRPKSYQSCRISSKSGFDGKNYYKLTIYIFGKRILSAFQRYMWSNLSFWGKNFMDRNVKGGIRSLTGQNVKIVNIRQSKHLAITSELLNEKDKKQEKLDLNDSIGRGRGYWVITPDTWRSYLRSIFSVYWCQNRKK